MSVDSITPTRMNLLQRKAQVKFAVDGVGLLKGKRDALMQELIDRARRLRDMRNTLHARGREAAANISVASAMRGAPELKSASIGLRRPMEVKVRTEKVWGLSLGDIDLEDIVRTPMRRPISMLDTSAYVQEASQSSEEMLEQLFKCAPLERNLQIIGEEVKKVSRRINALEEYLIPKLRGEMRHIARVLDEREREDVFRLKRIKGKKAAQKKLKEKLRRAAEEAEEKLISPEPTAAAPTPAPEPDVQAEATPVVEEAVHETLEELPTPQPEPNAETTGNDMEDLGDIEYEDENESEEE